jgi:hypothetical protein
MGQAVATYAPIELYVNINGYRVTGFSDTDILTITRDTPKFTKQTGVMDETARAHSASSGARLSLTLMQTSAANDILSGYLRNDDKNPSAANLLNIYITDHNGTFHFVSDNAWIVDYPESSFGNELQNRVWEIDCANSVQFVGGNAVNLGPVGAVGSVLESALSVS